MFKKILKPTITLVVVCVVVTALLAGTYVITKPAIDEQEALALAASYQEALPEADTFEDASITVDGEDVAYSVGQKAGETVGYVFTTSAKGYGGEIQVITGVSLAGEVTGVTIASDDETPGLGKKAGDESFRNQYYGAIPEEGFTVIKGNAAAENEISAITGATITSRAVTTAVNDALELYRKLCEGGA